MEGKCKRDVAVSQSVVSQLVMFFVVINSNVVVIPPPLTVSADWRHNYFFNHSYC